MHWKKTLEQVNTKKCIIEIFGLGNVEFPLSTLLANNGFKVTGIENSQSITLLKSFGG